MIIFNIEVEEERRTYHITERKPVRWYNCGRYGAVSFAVRRESLLQSGITFSCCLAAVQNTAMEKTACFDRVYKKGILGIYRTGDHRQRGSRESTWFHGYNEKFFHDRGVLYHYLYGWLERTAGTAVLYAHKGTLCSEVKPAAGKKQWMREGIREAGRR